MQHNSETNFFKKQLVLSKCSSLKSIKSSQSKSKSIKHANIIGKDCINLTKQGTTKIDEDQEDLSADISDIVNTYQLGGVLTKRLQELLTTMDEMTSKLQSYGSNSQCEDEDVDRAIKRSIEFDSMFSRNHLYEIQRLLKDSKLLLAVKSPRIELESKILAVLKSITQALQVYGRHVGKGNRVKYQQVVPIFQSISTIISLLEQLTGQHLFPLRQDLEVSCSKMKQILLEMSVTETPRMPLTTTIKPVNNLKPGIGQKVSSDLSMYNLKNRKPDWKSKATSLVRKKFGPPNNKKNPTETLKKSGSPSETKDFFKKSNYSGDDETIDQKNSGKGNEPKSSQGNELSVKGNKSATPKGLNSLNAKKLSKVNKFRKATRAVPESSIQTMMEIIRNEPLEDVDLCIDENTFEALKLANDACAPLYQAYFPTKQVSSYDKNKTESIENMELKLSLPPSLLSYTDPSTPTSLIMAASPTKAGENDSVKMKLSVTQSETSSLNTSIIISPIPNALTNGACGGDNVAFKLAQHPSAPSRFPSTPFTNYSSIISAQIKSCSSQKCIDIDDSKLLPATSINEKSSNIINNVQEMASNVQLICLKEGESLPIIPSKTNIIDGPITKLTIEESAKTEMFVYHKEAVESNSSDSQPMETKPVETLESVANEILREIVLDFQQEQVDGVIERLFELELQTFEIFLKR